MNTITVEVPVEIAKRYGTRVVAYAELIKSMEESFWTDIDVEPKMEMKEFYALLKVKKRV